MFFLRGLIVLLSLASQNLETRYNRARAFAVPAAVITLAASKNAPAAIYGVWIQGFSGQPALTVLLWRFDPTARVKFSAVKAMLLPFMREKPRYS